MYEIFELLLKQKGVKAYDVAKATGIRSGVLTDWKMGRYTPKMDKLQKIADYFGVSLEYLTTGKEGSGAEPVIYSKYEEKLVQTSRLLNEEGKDKLQDYAEDLSYNNRYIKSAAPGILEKKA